MDCIQQTTSTKESKSTFVTSHSLLSSQSPHMRELFNTGGGSSYLHTMISHYGEWYKKCDFLSASTEPGEAMFATFKWILLWNTNRQEEDSLIEVLIRLHFQQKLKETKSPYLEKRV